MSVFPHNEAAVALYRKFGSVEEGLCSRCADLREDEPRARCLVYESQHPLSTARVAGDLNLRSFLLGSESAPHRGVSRRAGTFADPGSALADQEPLV